MFVGRSIFSREISKKFPSSQFAWFTVRACKKRTESFLDRNITGVCWCVCAFVHSLYCSSEKAVQVFAKLALPQVDDWRSTNFGWVFLEVLFVWCWHVDSYTIVTVHQWAWTKFVARHLCLAWVISTVDSCLFQMTWFPVDGFFLTAMIILVMLASVKIPILDLLQHPDWITDWLAADQQASWPLTLVG